MKKISLFLVVSALVSASAAPAARADNINGIRSETLVYVGSWSNGMMIFLRKQVSMAGTVVYDAFRRDPSFPGDGSLADESEDCASAEKAAKASVGALKTGDFINPNFQQDLCASLQK